jgi:uncharacterized peroxidase-related enzyme
MPLIPPLRPEHASKEVYSVYVDFHDRMSFPSPPNFITTQGHSLAAARGTWGLVSNVLVGGEIPRWTKEMIFVAISKDRHCIYCEAAHIACCRMLGVNSPMLQELIEDVNTIHDIKVRAMIRFALKCSRNPQALAADDYESLKEVGLKQSEIVELIAMAGLAVYANIMADATGMEADEMFATAGGERAGAGAESQHCI